MSQLILSIGITFLTCTLLFVYFRNKMSNMDNKVNLVFKTIQDHQTSLSRHEHMRQQMINQREIHINEERDDQETNMGTKMGINMGTNETKEEIQVFKEVESPSLIEVSDLEKNTNIDFSESESDSDSDEDDEDDEDDDEDDEEKDDNDIVLKETIEEVIENVMQPEETVEDEVDKEETVEEYLEQFDYNSLTKVKLQNLCQERNISEYRKSHNKSKLVELLESTTN